MDIAPVQKTTPVVDPPTYLARPAGQQGSTPVATELAPSRTAQEPSSGFAPGPDDPRPVSDGHLPVVERNLSIDPDTHQIVYQAINARGEIVLQLPDQVVLRQRAYANDLENAAEKSGRGVTIERFI